MITGVYRAVPMRVNPRKRNVLTVFRTYIDVIHYQKNTGTRFASEDARQAKDSEFHTAVEERAELDGQIEREEREMREMGADPMIYEKLGLSAQSSRLGHPADRCAKLTRGCGLHCHSSVSGSEHLGAG